MKPKISVVIITKNEEENISRCIKSVLNEMPIITEIILVDSNSEDKTVEIAKRFPIKVIQLGKSQPLSPAAGRYIGTKNSTGKYIIFLDGDMVLIKGWIRTALKFLEKKNIAGLAGTLIETNSTDIKKTEIKHKIQSRKVITLGGGSMYKKSILDKVGTFNPYVRGEEERELSIRIRSHYKNKKLIKINKPMVYHINKHSCSKETLKKVQYFSGVGQLIKRYNFKILIELFKYYKSLIIEETIILITMLVIFCAILLKLKTTLFIISIILIFFILILVIIKGTKKIFNHIKSRLLIIYYVIKGIFMYTPNQEKYLSNNKYIKVLKK
jgi:glycosyltransferase involved in cell wall biosynthesis